ncbi:MAG: hypothetical protein ACTHOF_07470 [Flavisolibacter sp.]
MKKFLTFILFLTILIIAEYYFFIEMFSKKRTFILLPSLLFMLIAIYGIFRFAKKTISNTKHSQSHS